jgi:molecular chaperone GrpE
MGNRKKKKDELAARESDALVETPDAPLAVKETAESAVPEGAGREIEELERRLAEKTELAQGYFAQLQRVQADFENFQKRVEAEKTRIADDACQTIVSGLLDTLDNFERALSFLEKMPDEEARGVIMVYENMISYLKTNGLEKIASAGCRFDPHRHDAIMQAEVESGEDGAVLEEFQAGYAMKGKVIRPAKVKVARLRIKEVEDNNISKEE